MGWEEATPGEVEVWSAVLGDQEANDALGGRKAALDIFVDVSVLLDGLAQERIDIEGWEEGIRDLERSLNSDSFMAFERGLESAGQPLLACRTFINLAKRHVGRKANKGSHHSQRPPDLSEAVECARLLLAHDMDKGSWNRHLSADDVSKLSAIGWLSRRSDGELQDLIRGSESIRISWDALGLISDALAGKRVLGRRWEAPEGSDDLPLPLLQWHFEAAKGLRRPPCENAAPPGRPNRVGYWIRNIRIKDTIRTLAPVGIPPTNGQVTGCHAVAEVLDLDARRIREIWRNPDMPVSEFLAKFIRSLFA